MTFYNSGNARDEPNPHAAGGRETLIEALRWMAVYESANAATPRNRLQRVVKRNGDLLSNSSALMATSVLTSLLGFVYWWVADRSFSAEAVGAASAAISAMTLVGTLGMFGMGTLLISELPKTKDGQWSLISTCVLVAASVSAVGGVIYVGLALFAIPGLRSSLGSPLGIALLIVAMSLNAAMLVFDEGLVGLLLGHLQLLRNAYFAVGKLIVVGVIAILPVAVTGGEILGTWVAGILLSLPLLSLSLRSRGITSIRPRRSALRGLARNALDHNLLNVALFLPRTSLPLVVTSVVSTRANAAFYTAWMVMSFLAMIPGSIATTLFAVASGDSAALRARVRIGLVIALGIGVPVSTGIAVLARPIMSVFGSEYASAASGALSVLALTYVVGVIRQFYVAISRVQKRVRRASLYAVLIGFMELGAAWIGGRHGGLGGLVAWLAGAFVVEGVFMAPAVLRVALVRVAPGTGAAAAAGAAGSTEATAGDAAEKSAAVAAAATAASNDVRRHGRRHVTREAPETVEAAPPAPAPAPAVKTVPPRPRPAEQTMVLDQPKDGRTVAIPRQRTPADQTAVIPRMVDQTAVIPRFAPDETAVIPKVLGDGSPEETVPMVRPRVSPDETAVFARMAPDETAVIPKVLGDGSPEETVPMVRPRVSPDETMVIPRLRTDETAATPPRAS